MIRLGRVEDLKDIVEVYNQAIDARFQTAFMTRYTPEERIGWFKGHTADKYPLFVYELDSRAVGHLTVSPYRQGREALNKAVEISYFIDVHYRKAGIGSKLLGHGIEACKHRGYKTLLAIIMEPNIASAKLLEKFRFEKWGLLPDIADYEGKTCSQVYYGLKI